ncbi:MAG: hypothetical protein H7Z13_11820 [Ferruginibacter sp.]|nr:hypothetical protein [Ferruginibacter sp.]
MIYCTAKQYMMEQDENFSDDLQENLRIENEFLKIKLKAQYGDAFHMENGADMPPEIENQFLKSMMAFEDEYANAEYTTVYERLGQPGYKPVSEMNNEELTAAIKSFTKLMVNNDIGLDICDGPYPDELIYRFITEELFAIKVEKKPVAGMVSHFIYEEFHPNHKADITKRTHTFFKNWFNRHFTEYCTELSWHCITADGLQMTREDIISRMNVFFEAFLQFKDDGYNIDNISYELQEETQRGMGFAEGVLKYDAVMENGEIIEYNGPYKLYLQLEDNWWSIFYFVMPGFKW